MLFFIFEIGLQLKNTIFADFLYRVLI